MGGDSLSAARFSHLIKEEFGVSMPVEMILDKEANIEKLSQYIKSGKDALGDNKIDWQKEIRANCELLPFLTFEQANDKEQLQKEKERNILPLLSTVDPKKRGENA